MALQVAKPPAQRLDDLIDAVGELQAAIFDRDHGRTNRLVTAIDVGNAGHGAVGPG